jgi:uncharacterized protein YggE
MTRLRTTLLLAGGLLGAAAIAGVAQPHLGRAAAPVTTTTAATRTITVTGDGSVTVVPDRAGFDFTVDTKAQTAKAALAQNADAAAAVAAAVKGAGVDGKDIQTSQVSLSPQTNENGTQILGYSAETTVSVTSTIAKAGSIVDAAVGAGVDGVSGPSLTLSDQDAQYRDALKLAVADARTKAQALAEAGGVSLGDVQSIDEGSTPSPVVWEQKAAAPSAGDVQIEPGTQTVDATVTITYAAG